MVSATLQTAVLKVELNKKVIQQILCFCSLQKFTVLATPLESTDSLIMTVFA